MSVVEAGATARGGRSVPAAPVVADLVTAGVPRLGTVRVLCVDGPAGSGKTTLAARVVERLGVTGLRAGVVHLDDLYEGWSGLEGSLWPRLHDEVLAPLAAGRPGRYRRWDWPAGAFADHVDVPVPDVLVLEGCGSARRAADAVATVRAWVEAPAALRLERGLARDGAEARPQWERWMVDEAVHFLREGTRARADVRVDRDGLLLP